MPVNEKEQLEVGSAVKSESKTDLLTKADRKAPGTRWGTLADWRDASRRTGKIPGRYGRTLRDGR